jgi:hypothetical protein
VLSGTLNRRRVRRRSLYAVERRRGRLLSRQTTISNVKFARGAVSRPAAVLDGVFVGASRRAVPNKNRCSAGPPLRTLGRRKRHIRTSSVRSAHTAIAVYRPCSESCRTAYAVAQLQQPLSLRYSSIPRLAPSCAAAAAPLDDGEGNQCICSYPRAVD